MAKRLVLEGPAAAAVERLARQAGVSPAELIRRALRREDEAQRGDGGLPVQEPPSAVELGLSLVDAEQMKSALRRQDEAQRAEGRRMSASELRLPDTVRERIRAEQVERIRAEQVWAAQVRAAAEAHRSRRSEDEAQHSEGGSVGESVDPVSPDKAEGEGVSAAEALGIPFSRGGGPRSPVQRAIVDPDARIVSGSPLIASSRTDVQARGAIVRFYKGDEVSSEFELLRNATEQFLQDRPGDTVIAERRPGDASRPASLIVNGVFNGNRLSFEMPYPPPGEFSFPFPEGRVIVTVPPGDGKPAVCGLIVTLRAV